MKLHEKFFLVISIIFWIGVLFGKFVSKTWTNDNPDTHIHGLIAFGSIGWFANWIGARWEAWESKRRGH